LGEPHCLPLGIERQETQGRSKELSLKLGPMDIIDAQAYKNYNL
jgi:hypothetical protein